jgi:hypothetical protein
MNRRNQVLAAVLAAQLLLIALVFWPRKAATVSSGQILFPGIEADRVVQMTIRDAQGQSLTLVRRPNGWVLPDADDYPCQEENVSAFLTKLLALKGDRLVTQTATSHKRLKVADDAFERLVEFELSDGTKHKLYMGTSAGAQSSHIRADGQNEVYLSGNLSSWDVGAYATAWIDSSYLSVPQDQVVTLTLDNAAGHLAFTRISTDTWTLQGLGAAERLDQNQVQTIVSRAASDALSKPLGKTEKPEFGMGKPSATVMLETRASDGTSRSYALRVGARDATDSTYVVQSSESPYFVQVSEWVVQDLVEKDRSGFLEPPPAPEATPAP